MRQFCKLVNFYSLFFLSFFRYEFATKKTKTLILHSYLHQEGILFLEGKKLLNARVTRKDLVRSKKKGKCKIKECDQEILTQNISFLGMLSKMLYIKKLGKTNQDANFALSLKGGIWLKMTQHAHQKILQKII